jgi:MHS family proline/betaine transporter-like MFS transporter
MIMMAGLILAVFLYRPIYAKMYAIADVSTKIELPEKRKIETETTRSDHGEITTQTTLITYTDGSVQTEAVISSPEKGKELKKHLTLSGDAYYAMIGLVLIQLVLVTMVYGPIAAFLVELFPTRIRYTSMSLPYHIGNGIFGGLTPFLATFLFEQSKTSANPSGDPLAGLWYPIVVSAITFIIGMIFLSNKKKAEVND